MIQTDFDCMWCVHRTCSCTIKEYEHAVYTKIPGLNLIFTQHGRDCHSTQLVIFTGIPCYKYMYNSIWNYPILVPHS